MDPGPGAAPEQTQRPRATGRRAHIPRALDGRRRAVIEDVTPQIDGGRFPVKRVVGERVVVEADAFTDGHDVVACVLRHRRSGDDDWHEVPMEDLGNDRRRAEFVVRERCPHQYTVAAWVDHYATWRRGLLRKVEAGQDVAVDLLSGAALILEAAERGQGAEAARLGEIAREVAGDGPAADRVALATSEETARLVAWFPDLAHAVEHPRPLEVWVDRRLGRTSTWYELFPRSLGAREGRHGTLADVRERLDEIAEMGFDVLYLPPIHPIGVTKRKGRNNAVQAIPGDVGSPWAIGSEDGGHDAVHPQLGTIEDVRLLAAAARERGIDLALDLALQCSPDHPWVTEHPGWFRTRPDGTVQYAENPPKRYEDIYPIDFETDDWQALWRALLEVVRGWIACGVRVFRVDNPHTKPFAFWEWLIAQVHRDEPDVLFLAEAFTRPKVMRRLAKLGFTQSYTYFAWRNTRWELTEYFTELTRTEQREYFRPNVWPNTPDILTEYLQTGGRPAFVIRLVLAATLAASYGVYGPAFELAEGRPREHGSEEYLDSEKYELRDWDRDSEWSLADLIRRVNAIRRAHPALQTDEHLAFHPTDNDHLLCYSKHDPESGDTILAVVNLDPFSTQSGWTSLDLSELGLDDEPYLAQDLLGGGRYTWRGAHNFVQLNPQELPAHVFALRPRGRAARQAPGE